MQKVGRLIVDILNAVLAFLARNIKRLAWFVLVTVLIFAVFAFAYTVTYNFVRTDEYQTYDTNGEVVTIDIPEGSTAQEIGQILKDNGLIDNVLLFRLKAKLVGAEDNFQYGVYKIVKGMPDETIMAVLEEGGKTESVTITIPEGWSVRQIGEYLEEQNICLASEFEEACNRTDYDFDYYSDITNRSDRQYLLEGYLWPDTYEIVPENGAEGVVKRLIREFERKWQAHTEWQEKAQELGLTVDQVVTMASCIEREAQVDSERAKVARVLYNRNEQGMAWQLNSTILYALRKEGTGDDFVSYDDLNVDSGYNTYTNTGFPVGPISNPGASSIEAVLNPAEGDWIYFIAYDDGTGEHLFTSNYDDFLAVQNGTYVRTDESTTEDSSGE